MISVVPAWFDRSLNFVFMSKLYLEEVKYDAGDHSRYK